MELGIGVLGFPPEVFWEMTYQEFTAAIDGYEERNGKKKHNAPTLEEAEQLRRQVNARKGEKVADEIKELFKRNGRRDDRKNPVKDRG
jgi:hypothetical protein